MSRTAAVITPAARVSVSRETNEKRKREGLAATSGVSRLFWSYPHRPGVSFFVCFRFSLPRTHRTWCLPWWECMCNRVGVGVGVAARVHPSCFSFSPVCVCVFFVRTKRPQRFFWRRPVADALLPSISSLVFPRSSPARLGVGGTQATAHLPVSLPPQRISRSLSRSPHFPSPTPLSSCVVRCARVVRI